MAGSKSKTTTLVGTIVEEEVVMSLGELCRAAQLSAERVIELAEEGVIEPVGRDPRSWRFRGTSLRRIRCALRLEADLGVNVAGVALALQLLDEVGELRARLARLEPRE